MRAAEWGDDKLKLSYSIKKVPVVGGGVALLTCAINDPTVGCVTCGAAVVGAATGAGAVAGAVSIGAFAVPAAFVAGEGMQWLWDNHLANLPPIAWTIDGISTAWSYTGGPVVDYAGDGLKKVGGWIGDKVR